MISTLILDAGGVLVYPPLGEWNIPAGYRAILGEKAATIPGPRWDAARDAAIDHLREDVFLPDMDAELEKRLLFLRAVDRDLQWNLDEGSLRALAEDFTRNPARYGWYEDMIPMLEKWQGKYRTGMLTDAMPSFPVFVRLRGVDGYFEKIVASTQVGACKPDPRMYNEICRQMGVEPSECLFVDDKPCNLLGAMAVGMQAVQMCRDGLEPWNGPHVHNLEELNAYLEELQ